MLAAAVLLTGLLAAGGASAQTMVPLAPTFPSVSGVGTYATTTPGSIKLTWVTPSGPVATSHEFRTSTDSGVNWSHSVTDDWPDTTQDSKGKRHLPGLTPGTAYTFELRGRNADGYGAAVQATGTAAGAVSITGVAFTSNPASGTTYDTGEDVVATLTFSRRVTVAEVGGNLPQLELNFGGTAKPAICAAAIQKTAVACTYTVVFGDAASGGVAIAANKLTLNGGTIRLGSGSSANVDYTVPLAHMALAADTDHKVNGTTAPPGPTVSSIAFNSAGTDGAFKTGDPVTATVTFSESVTVDTTDGTPQLTIKMGGTDKVLAYSSGSPGTALVFSGYTVAANDEDTDGLSIEANKLDANGGTIQKTADTSVAAVLTHAAVAASANHKVDGVKPTLVTMGDNAPKTTLDGSQIILVFSEAIGGVDRTKITVKKGTTTVTTTADSINGTKVEITLTTALTTSETVVTVELSADAVTDVPGNGIAAVSATSVTRILPPGKPTLTLAAKDQSIDATVVFSTHGTSDITKYQYRTKTTGSYGSWTDSTDNVSNTGGTFTIGGLTNGTEYTVQARGVNSDGEGAESDAKAATPDAPPAVSSVAITSDPGTDNTYAIDDDIVVTVTFDKTITFGAAGTLNPYVTLEIGLGDDEPACIIGTGNETLVCTETVVVGDEDADGIRIEGDVGVVDKHVLGPLGQVVNYSFSAIEDDSGHKVDGIRPTLSRADADPNDLTKIILTFSEAIGTVDNTKITVKKGGTDQTTTGAAIDSTDSTKVEITLMTALLTTDTNVTVDLDADAVKDVPGNGIAEVLGTSVSLVDNVAPTFVSAGTSGTDKVVLTYSEALNTMQPATSAFPVKVGGNTRGVDTVAISGSAVTLTLASAFRPGDTLTVAYSKPGTNPIKDAADNEADSLAETMVTNNLPATAPDAPGSLAAGTVNISTAPVRVAADIFELSWIIPWHNGSAIEKHQYRYAEGTSVPPSTTWVDIPNSAPGQPNDTDFNVTGLDADTEYTFEVRAVNGIDPGPEATVTRTTATPAWSFTLRDSSNNNVTELTEGGDAATATVSITNNVRFGADQTVQIEWGGFDISSGLIQGAGGASTITILAEGASGSLEISAPQGSEAFYQPNTTAALTALHDGSRIGDSIDLTFADDEGVPVATITDAPDTVNEGESIEIEITLTPASSVSQAINATITDDDNALSGTLQTPILVAAGQTSRTITLTAAENTTQNDGAHDVTFALALNDDSPYTLGTAPAVTSVTITVRDDDTPPLAVRKLTAQAGNTEATLRWDAPAAPTPDHGQPVLHYEYRVKVGTGSFGSWTRFPNSDADTRSHKFTGLTNGTEYTYEVAAVNVAGRGTEAQKSVTPLVGIAVSFGAATLSVDEGDQATVTVTLALAPAVGETVTVPIVATQGTGLNSNEYSGVPEDVTFNAGDTSKSFTVTAVQDTDDEPDRLLTFSFGTPLPEGYVPGTNSQLVLTLVDDDVPIVSATFDAATAEVQEGTSRTVTVSLGQVAPEREVVVPIRASRGANLAADEVSGVPESVTFAADAIEARFTVAFEDDAVVEGSETLTLTFGTYPDRVQAGTNTRLTLTVTDDDGPPLAPDVSVQTGDGYAELSWAPVANDSPVLRYEVRWRESDGGTFNAWQRVGLETSHRVEGLTNDRAYEFEVRAVNAHGDGEEASAPGTPTERLTGIPKAPQWLRFADVTDSSRAELKWGRPSNGTDRVTANSASATFSQIQGYRIEVCRTTCGDEANWYAVVANTRAFVHKYVHQVLAPGVIRENRYRVQAININGKTGPWSNVATLDPTRLERFWLVSPNSSTVDVHLEVWNPDGNPLYVRYTGGGEVRYAQQRLTKKGFPVIGLPVEASTHYRVEVDFVDTFDSPRLQSATVWSLQEGADPYTSPYAKDLLDAEVWRGGQWREAPDNELYLRMGETGKYRVRLKPCGSIYSVIPRRIQAPAGRLRASPTDFEPSLFSNLNCEVVQDGWRTDEAGNFVTLGDIYDMTNFQDRANDRIPIYAGTPNVWREVTVTARALEDYPSDVRADALLSAPFAVVYNHEVYYGSEDPRSGLVSEGTGLVRISLDRPEGATLPVPTGVTIASATRVMSWDAVPGASHYLVEWRYGPRYSNRANTDRSHVSATSKTLPLGGSGRGPITARVRAYSASAVSAWSAELTWDSRPPTLNVLDTAVNEDDGSVGFLVTLDPAASGTVTVNYATQDGTAVAGTDYTATSGTLTFAPGEREKKTALVPIADDDEEDSGETFRLLLSNPTGSDANNGAAVLGDAEAVATILNSEREAAELTGFTLVDAGTNGDLMALADGVTVPLGELLASSYGIRAETSPGAAPGSVRLALTGARTVTRTDDAAPWSLYGDGAGRINGAGLPAGAYTLTATAYANSGGQGDEQGSLEVSFTVAAGALAVTTPGPFTVAEGETDVTTLAASDTGTGGTASWSIPAGTAGGADGAAFALTAEGVLSLVAAKDFEAPDDADGDGTYQVTVEVHEGAQSATAALLVTLTDVNDAPVAVASASPARVREGAEVTLDGSASADPDAGDTLTYEWSQIQDGAPRVVLSDANAAQPAFTSPSDLAAETGLGFTLKVTDAAGLHAEATVTVTVTLVSEVSIAAASGYAAEGADAVFRLARAGSALKALTVPVTVEETGAMLGVDVPASATFAAGARETELRVPTAADAVAENDSRVTVRLGSGSGWQLAADAAAASLTVLDDDVAPSVSAADVTIWSADMTVVEYGPRSIGAGTAAQFSNQMGRAGLRAKRLWYDPTERKLRIGFDDGLDDAELLTLHMGGVSVGFPANSGGDSSFTLENVDVSWSDGETLAVRVSKPSAVALSTDATLASLSADGATLSPAFDAGVLVYRAVAGAETQTVTLAAAATDGGASVAYGPGEDADTALADHQVAVPDAGETLVEVTVTAADGTVRRYRVVVARAAAGANAAPAGLPEISGTAQVGETLTASADAITDADGIGNASFAWQWLANDGATEAAVADATASTYTVAPADAGRTLRVRVTFTDDKGTAEVLTSAPTEPVAAVASDAPGGLAVATAEGRSRELTVSWSAPASDGGAGVTGYRVQWKSGTEAYDGSEESTRQAVLGDPAILSHTVTGLTVGTAYTVRVLAVNAAGAGAAAEATATVQDRVVPALASASANGTILTLTFSEALDAASQPAADAFAVSVEDTARTVDAVALSGSAVALTLASAVAAEETVTVGYTVPTGADAAPLQDASGNAAAGFAGEAVRNDTPEPENTAPAGLPEISGTAQVGETLTASVSAIEDEDGLDNATFAYQWLANDGTDDSEIAGATNATWEVAPEQVGRTLKVRATFTDDKGTEETLTSAVTETVAARAPDAPGGLAVATAEGREGELSVSWTAPARDGGAEVTGYRVQWKSGTEAYDGSEASTRQALVNDPAIVSHTVTGLTVGTAYTVRVLAVNAAGAGAAAEATATAEDRVVPALASASVDGTILTLTYNEALDTASQPAAGAFAVTVDGTARTVDAVALSGSAVALTLASAVAAEETVTVGYTVPTGADAAPLQDAAGNDAAGFAGEAVTNDTAEPENAAPAGLPEISGTAEVGETLTASVSAIEDEDGLDNATFAYQWLANDGTEDSEIAGATNATWEVAPEQAGKTLKVRVTFTDDKGTEETLVSAATDTVVDRGPVSATLSVGAGAAEAGRFRLRIAFGDAVTGLAPADVTASRVGGGAAAVTALAEAETGRAWTAWVAADAGRYTVWLAAGAAEAGERRSLAAVLAVDVDAAGNATAVAGPVVTSVGLASASDGTWTDGETLGLSLTFSEPVTVATGGGTPTVGIALDGTARQASYASGSGRVAVFTYRVTADDGTVSAASLTADSLALNGGTIRDAAGRDADLEHPGIGEATEETETESAAVLTGLVLVDTGTGAETALADGAALVLDDPANGSWGLVASVAPEAQVGSVVLALTGAKTVAVTDDAAPFSLHGDEDGTVAGAGLPAGSYTLKATAYPEAGGGGAALGTLSVSFTVAASAPVDPDALTASFAGMPAEHGGPGAEAFTFELAFSENPKLSYKRLRKWALWVTDGSLGPVRRLNPPSNAGWTIEVTPSGWDDVTVTLAGGGRPCVTTGAICTADGKTLENSPVATVPGPVALSVADARVDEGPGALLAFQVTLNRAASGSVTVDYATGDGTATAGADYTAASGTLTFDPGETAKTVDVTVLDDAHDDTDETLTLTLSNASGARIRDGEATGTIENSDPIPQAWLARFGRTVADHVVDAVAERLTGPAQGGSQVTLGGQRVPIDGSAGGVAPVADRAAGDEESAARDALTAFADRIGGSADGGAWERGADGALFGDGWTRKGASATERSLTGRELLLGSSFVLNLSGDGEDGAGAAGARWTAWGRASSSRFDGEADGLVLDGDVTTFTFGADAARGRWLGGVALAHSTGEGGYRDHDDSGDPNHPGRGSGTLESSLTSVHPYARLAVSERLSLWGLLGYGTGELDVEVDGVGRWSTDTTQEMAAAGARGVLVKAPETGGFELGLRGDAVVQRMRSDAATGEAGNLAAADARTSRLRLTLEGSRAVALEDGGRFVPTLGVGLRQDGGDAETGTGIEVGGGVSYADPATGLTVEGKARGLVAHEDTDYREWGASASVRLDPGAAGRGLSLSLSPAWGADSGNAERLWGLGEARGLAANDGFEPAGRLDAEAGWGFGAFGGRGLATPFAGLSLSDAGERTWRTGVRWTLGPDTAFGVEGSLREAANDNEAEHGVRFKFIARW